MKKTICLLLAVVMTLSLCACGGSAAQEEPAPDEGGAAAAAPSESPEEQPAEPAPDSGGNGEEEIDDPAWDQLEKLGRVETENGLFYVSVTLPADFAGEGVTQESIDAAAGETYTSGKLNEDGSVTYKMTKQQHKAMLEGLTQSIEDGLQDLVASTDSFTQIDHNADFTQFDVTLNSEQMGLTETFMVLGLYMYGGMYALFSGQDAQDVTVNYYSPSGELLQSANSADMAG